MFGSLGVPEILFILVLALLVFGPRRLPELGRTIGRAMGEFRRASTDLRRTLNNELALEDESPRRPASAPQRIAGGAAATADAGAPPVPRPAAGTAPRGADAAEAEAAGEPAGAEPEEEASGSSSPPEPPAEARAPDSSGAANGAETADRTADGPPIAVPTNEPR